MKLNPEPLTDLITITDHIGTLTSVEDFYPGELTSRYTNGAVIEKISHPSRNPALQRLIYAICVERRISVVEYRMVNGRFQPFAPWELAEDNTVDGAAVAPLFKWIDAPGSREQLRLYCTAPRPDNGGIWTLRFCWPDLPIFRPWQ